MHNDFETLQRQCRSYRLKRLMRRLIPLLLIIAVALVALYYYMSIPCNSDISHEPLTLPSVEKADQPLPLVVQHVAVIEDNNSAKKLHTSIPTEPMSHKALPTKDVNYEIHVDEDYIPPQRAALPKKAPPPPPPTDTSKKVPIAPVVVVPKPALKQHQPLSMSVKQIDSIETMQQLYENEPSYAQALNIARHYYQTQRYSQAALWAKKANILERKRDGAWILYAKAEYAKGNKNRAIEILRLYLANAHSDEGNTLLRSWTQGE